MRRVLDALRLAAGSHSFRLAQQAHTLSLTLGALACDPAVASNLISAYSHLGLPSLSRAVFDSALALRTPHSAMLWNSLLSAYCNNRLFDEPIFLFARMCTFLRPDNFTLAIVSKAAAELGDLEVGRSVHCLVVKLGFDADIVLCNSITRLYRRCGCLGSARQMFDEMPVRSVSSWNSMISEFVKLEDGEGEVWNLLKAMQLEGLKPDAFTVCTFLPMCQNGIHGREIHGYIVRNNLGLDSDLHVRSSLISFYSKDKNVDAGRRVFDGMVLRNVVAWTAMINGYVENGEFQKALDLFRMMQWQGGISPNKVSLVNVLPAIGSLAKLIEGKQVHAFAIRKEMHHEISLNNALIDMYSKCGRLDSAECIFNDDSWVKDAISWSSMISSYGIHGKGKEALSLFDRMCSLGVKPDHVISVGILSACGRAGLVSSGFEIYNSLVKDHRIVPTTEICSCIVNMLGRAGRLYEALDFIDSVPQAHSSSVWGALFDSSLIHNNQEIQELACMALLQLEPENPSNYVSLSNLHASSGRWDVAAEVRQSMKNRCLKKIPGFSFYQCK